MNEKDLAGVRRNRRLRDPGDTADLRRFSQIIDGRRGRVRAVGDLDRRTADQLRGSVEALRRSGHRHVLVDLHGLRSVDEPGLSRLRSLVTEATSEGVGVTVLHLPTGADGTSP